MYALIPIALLVALLARIIHIRIYEMKPNEQEAFLRRALTKEQAITDAQSERVTMLEADNERLELLNAELLEALEYALEILSKLPNVDDIGMYPIQHAIAKAKEE